MDKRELDKLFRENLGDYRDQPDPRVWDRIRNSLDQKKKPRAIPIWWQWGAAAAILLGALFLTTPWKDSGPVLPAVTNTAPVEDSSDTGDPGDSDPIRNQPEQNALTESDVETPLDTSEDPENPLPSSTAFDGQVAGRSGADEDAEVNDKRPASTEYASNEASDKAVIPNPEVDFDPTTDRQVPVVAGNDRMGDEALESEVAMAESDVDPDDGEAEIDNSQKQSIFDAIEASKAVAETVEEAEKWSLGPSVAPVYFNSFGDGSPIASNFVNNSKSGTINMSYGLQVSYKLSDKLRLRSGVHKVDYGYNTEDVGFTSSPSAQPSSLIRTISYSEASRNLVVESMVDDQQPVEPGAVDVSAPNPAREGQMVQEFGYLEIPLEMQYSLIDKKWGLDLIGGMSSLFLVNNTVSLEADGGVTEMGEANNVNSLNFSTNFGLGFFYRFTPSFELNLQPMFKYQLNTFTETAGDFRPYSIGVYSGLSFRF